MIDYVNIALSRLPGQFQSSPKLKALLAALIDPLVQIESDAELLINNRWINSADGKQLDGCGYIVGEPRLGRDDDTYRDAIKFRVFINVSNGTPNDIIKSLKILTSPIDCQYIEAYPATSILFTDGFFVSKKIHETMQDICPASISNVPVAVSFRDSPLRFSKEPPPGELFVNSNADYLAAEDSDIQVSAGGFIIDGAGLGGIVPAELDVGIGYLDIGGSTLAVYEPNSLNTIGHYNLTGVFQ